MTDTQFVIFMFGLMVASTLGIGVGVALAEFIVRAVDRARANRRVRTLRQEARL